ncbi:F-box protein At5g51380-like [Impatiens glandulifera]|uniref:F-box protein At5g51380-like n=1 Tax=Impatiens glandulifera TaxID=253017 RepID=UPI001FB0BA9B|nr:F-box protein At5g51380-like [Impatiens glandulifera]
MSLVPEKNFMPRSRRRLSLSDLWLNDQTLKNVAVKMRRLSLSYTPPSEPDETLAAIDHESGLDSFSPLSDELLLLILSKLPESQHISNSAVCKRWTKLSGRLLRSVKLLDWDFLESGRLTYRFPNLTCVDLVRACIRCPRNSGIVASHKFVQVHLDTSFSVGGFIKKQDVLHPNMIDKGVRILSEGCPNLSKLVTIAGSEEVLSCIAEECLTMQELELHCCSDSSLIGISKCHNLQILKLIGHVNSFYDSVVSDIGLTIVAQGCKRLVKLELVGCEGSFDGIKAIGQCCHMLEELTLHDHRMDGGWLAAISYCTNLKTLKLQSCKNIDLNPGPDEHLGSCKTLDELHLQQCRMQDKEGVRALFVVCETVRKLVLDDCWGLDDNVFFFASNCRWVRYLSIEGCSLLSGDGFEAVVLTWRELERLKVGSCNNIKGGEISPELISLFSVLKELKWRPDSKSLLSSSLEGTGVGKKGGRSFNL